MIIQCQKCQTRFRLDDSRITDKGVKVRCTKCKHVFTVQREEPEAELTGFTFPVEAEAPSATPEERSFVSETVLTAPVDSEAFEESSPSSEPADFSPFETPSFDASAISFESDSFDSASSEDESAAVGAASKGGEVDFSAFDFGDSDLEPDSTSLLNLSVDGFSDTTAELAPTESQKEAPQGLDFSDANMFGAVVQNAPDSPDNTAVFDFEGDSFAESMDLGDQGLNGKSGPLFSADDASVETSFNPDITDFSEEPASAIQQQVNPDDLKPSKEILFTAPAEDQAKLADESARSFSEGLATDNQQELPPLSIASRRKQSPIFSALIAVVAVLVVSVIGYLGYSSISSPKESAVPETGKIGVRAVKAAFLKNDKAGDLLVISGEALNEYPKARASLQVKVTVFDATGQSMATKSAYGGNPLTKEQMESLPLDKIEAAMANQFGDSLANMEVPPGKAIPFVVVLANIPKEAKDFAVQSSGSTVSTGKQR